MVEDTYIDIPTVDISAFFSADESVDAATVKQRKLDAVKSMVKAVETYGSFWVANGRYNKGDRDSVLQSITQLFQVKGEDRVYSNGTVARGYLKFGSESGKTDIFENKEGFSFGFSDWERTGKKPGNDMEAYNIWPATDESVFTQSDRNRIEKTLFDLCNDVGDVLVKMFSIDLHGDENVLADAWKGGETTALGRIFRYFSDGSLPEGFTREQYNAVMGSSPHTDWGLLTLIVADDTPGLQLFWDGKQVGASRDAEAKVKKDASGAFADQTAGWYTVRPEFDQGKIFVNTGDFMAIVSKGRYISPLHRVLSPQSKKRDAEGEAKKIERKSCVFFYYPNYEATIPTQSADCQQTYSVFTDQANDNSALKIDGDMSFGKFISQKWVSVSRGA